MSTKPQLYEAIGAATKEALQVIENRSNATIGREGEEAIIRLLRIKGFSCSGRLKHNSPFDLICEGKRVEVKTCDSVRRNGMTTWLFNIHRHGLLDESQVDVYALRLTGVPEFNAAITLFIPAPLGRHTIQMSFRSLLTRWGAYHNNLKPFRESRSIQVIA